MFWHSDAFVIWMITNQGWHKKWGLFLDELGKVLVTPHNKKTQHVPLQKTDLLFTC